MLVFKLNTRGNSTVRKWHALFTIVSILTLCACGSNAIDQNTHPMDDASASTDSYISTEEAENASTSENANDEPIISTFGASQDSLIKALRNAIADSDFPDLLSDDPVINRNEASEYIPADVSYTYSVADGASLVLYSVESSSELYHAYLCFTPASLTTDAEQSAVGYLVGLLESAFEPNVAMREQIDTELNLSNTSIDGTTFATGTIANWTYIISNGSCQLSIMAK